MGLVGVALSQTQVNLQTSPLTHPLSSPVRVDQAGVICKQEGFFRVNCVDCLDRTNVVQAAIARVVMEQQVRRDL